MWARGVPPKVQFFVWKLSQNMLSTLQNLARHDIISLNETIYGVKNEDNTFFG